MNRSDCGMEKEKRHSASRLVLIEHAVLAQPARALLAEKIPRHMMEMRRRSGFVIKGRILMKRSAGCSILIAFTALMLSACGGSVSTPMPTSHSVDLSWTANREVEVNKAGGGYRVAISGQPVIDLPYASGVAAPTSTSTTLMSGGYTVTVTAYSALNPTGTVSAAFGFSVPY